MSQLSCKCGKGMYKTDCPSEYSVYIYYESEVEKAIQENPSVSLVDFLTNWDTVHNCSKVYTDRKEPVEYWFCPSCKRVYEVQDIPRGRWLRIYTRVRFENKYPDDISTWKHIYVMTDVETDNATEENYEVSLVEYLHRHHNNLYYLSPDEKEAFVINQATSQVVCLYALEDSWTSSS